MSHTIQPSMRTQLAAMSFHIMDKRTDRKKCYWKQNMFWLERRRRNIQMLYKILFTCKKTTNMIILILDIVSGKFNRVGKFYSKINNSTVTNHCSEQPRRIRYVLAPLCFPKASTTLCPPLTALTWRNSTNWAQAASVSRFIGHTQFDTHTPGRTPVNWCSARQRGRYLTL